MQIPHNDNAKNPIFSGALLAGGNSRRMGQDKALIMHAGRSLWQHCLDALGTVCNPILIAGDRPDLATESRPCYADDFPGSSLAGLQTALTHTPSDWVTVLPCDLPFPSSKLLQQLQSACADGIDAVIPRSRFGREPLIGCYHKSALPRITERLVAGQPKILDLLDELAVHYLDEDELPTGWRRALRNLNSPADLERLNTPPPVVTFIAASGTGKTTLLEKVITELCQRGWSIGALKHDAHTFEIDHEGKDSWRLTQAGAAITAISSPAKTAIVEQHERQPGIDQLLSAFTGKVDLVLTEGFKQSRLPKIEVHRAELNRPFLSRGEQHDPYLVGVASSGAPDVDVPVFDLNNATELVNFIEEKFLA